jgi:hypothetical protein
MIDRSACRPTLPVENWMTRRGIGPPVDTGNECALAEDHKQIYVSAVECNTRF